MIDKIKKVLKMKAGGMYNTLFINHAEFLTGELIKHFRFLWVDLQVKAICDTCEDDQTSDRVSEVLEKLPEGIMGI